MGNYLHTECVDDCEDEMDVNGYMHTQWSKYVICHKYCTAGLCRDTVLVKVQGDRS